jgi:hypothetical protein
MDELMTLPMAQQQQRKKMKAEWKNRCECGTDKAE